MATLPPALRETVNMSDRVCQAIGLRALLRGGLPCRCRHEVEGVVQWISLLLSKPTSLTSLRLNGG